MLHTKPYKSPYEQLLNVCNESFILIVAYLVSVINGITTTSTQFLVIGVFIKYTLYANWSINFIAVGYTLLKEIKRDVLKWLYKRAMKKLNEKKMDEVQKQ